MATPVATPNDAASERRRMRAATTIFAGATVLSRVAGLLRESIAAAVYGVGSTMSAFTIAFQIPNLIRALLADAALNAAFVPVFTELREHGEEERAWRIASTFLMLIVLVLTPVTILCMAFAHPIVDLFTGAHFHAVPLAVQLFRIMLPIVVLFALSGVTIGILNTYDHFSTPALAPVAWNLVLVGSLVGVVPHVSHHNRIYVYAVAMVIGTLVQLVMPLPWLRGRGGRISVALDWRDPAVKSILVAMLPVTISLGLINLNLLVNTFFSTDIPASLLAGHSGSGPAALDKAFRIYILPQGIFSVAVSTVFFPVLARFAARNDMEGFRTTFADGLRQIFVLLIPSTAFLVVLANPVVALLYQHGKVGADQVPIMGGALAGFTWGLIFNGAGLLLIRSFFSLRSPWIPTAVSLMNLVLNTAIVWVLVHDGHGVYGIALATSIVNVMSFCTMYAVLQRRIGLLGTKRTATTFILAGAASAVSASLAWLVWKGVQHELGTTFLPNTVAVTAAATVMGVVYLTLVVQMRVIDSSELRRLARRGKAAGE